jgi:hypothetical protein
MYVNSVLSLSLSKTYTEYGNTVNIEGKSIRKLPAAAPAAAAAKK